MKQTILTINQSELLDKLIVKYGQIVTSAQIYTEAAAIWNLQQAKNTITKLVDHGWLIRIKRGLYLISDFANRGFLSLSPYVVANLLVDHSYVSFESALSHYGMFDQLTNKVISVSMKRHAPVNLDSMEFSFVKTQDQYYFGWQEASMDGHTARIASAEKALIDIVHFHKSKYAIDLVIEKLLNYQDDLEQERLMAYVRRMSMATLKVFGVIFDLVGIDSAALYETPGIKQGTHWMLPGDTKFNAKWRLYYDPFFDKYKKG